MNQIVISGIVGNDPKLDPVQCADGNVKAKATFNVSVFVGKKPDGTFESTWFKCVAWEKRADYANKNIHKKSRVIVSGQMRCREFTADGTKVVDWYVDVDKTELACPNQNNEENATQVTAQPTVPSSETSVPDEKVKNDLPF